MSLDRPPRPLQPLKAPVKTSATMALNTRVNEMLAAGEKVYHLGFGESRFPVHPKILEALRANADRRSYLPVAGLPALRQAVADYYRRKFQIDATAERVIIGSGSKCLIYAALAAMEGDLLLPAPTWVSYDTQADLTGKAVTWLPTSPADDYCLTPDGLQAGLDQARAAGQSPGILILNSPGNPTGTMYPSQLLAGLAEVARAEGLVVISDEIYALTAHGLTPHQSIAQYYPEGTIVTGGLSKHLSLGGWRLGVAVLPTGPFGAGLLSSMIAVGSNIWTTASAPIQYAAVVAYGNDPELDAYVATCADIHRAVTQHLYQVTQRLGLPCPQPTGGFYLYPSFKPWRAQLSQQHGVHTCQDLAHFLLSEAHLAVLPGADFGDDPANLSLRLSTSYLFALDDTDAEAVLVEYQRAGSEEAFLQAACPQVIEAGERLAEFVKWLG